MKAERQVQIVNLGGLRLLVPLTRSRDAEVRRLAAHALANLSVDAQNQIKLAEDSAIPVLIALLACQGEIHVQRQAAKALATLASTRRNKERVAEEKGIIPLVELAQSPHVGVRVEAVAALANLAL